MEDKVKRILIVLLVVLVLGTVGVLAAEFRSRVPTQPVNEYIETISNKFLDVNEDGAEDWIYKADVVINRDGKGVGPNQTPVNPPNPRSIP